MKLTTRTLRSGRFFEVRYFNPSGECVLGIILEYVTKDEIDEMLRQEGYTV